MIHFRRLRMTLLVAIGALALSCAEDDNNGESCWGNSACVGGLANLIPHPCQREVTATCGDAGADSSCAKDTMLSCATDYYLRNYAPNALPDCSSSHPPLTIGDGT